MVRAVHAMASDGIQRPASAVPLLESVIEPLNASPCPKHQVVLLVRRLSSSHSSAASPERLRQLQTISADALLAFLLDQTPGEMLIRYRAYLIEHEVREYPSKGSVVLRQGFKVGPDPIPAPALKEGVNEFHIEVRGDHVKLALNGQAAIDEALPQTRDVWNPGHFIALGARRTGARHVIEFGGITIKVLPEPAGEDGERQP